MKNRLKSLFLSVILCGIMFVTQKVYSDIKIDSVSAEANPAAIGDTVKLTCNASATDDETKITNYQDLKLTVTVPQKIYLGLDVVFTISLESKSEQSLYSLETADLQIVVKKIDNPTKKYTCNRWQIRRIETMQGLVKTIKIKKQRIIMNKGDSSSIKITMLNDFNTRLSYGRYSVTALYEDKVIANNIKFSIVLNYERTVPTLINLIASSDEWTRSWARNRLFSIVGQPVWKPSQFDTKEHINMEVKALRNWWKENRDLILLVESKSKANKN